MKIYLSYRHIVLFSPSLFCDFSSSIFLPSHYHIISVPIHSPPLPYTRISLLVPNHNNDLPPSPPRLRLHRRPTRRPTRRHMALQPLLPPRHHLRDTISNPDHRPILPQHLPPRSSEFQEHRATQPPQIFRLRAHRRGNGGCRVCVEGG